MSRKIAIALSKGGVGKTTTATTLAYGLAQKGKRVLLVDCDTQGQASFFLGTKQERGLAEVLLKEAKVQECIDSARPNLDILAGGRRLAEATLAVSHRTLGIERALTEALSPINSAYDFVLLDCAPGWDILSVNALIYATEILCPVALQMASIESLGQFIKRVEDVQVYNPELAIQHILPTLWDVRSKESQNVLAQLQEHFGDRVYLPIHSTVKVFEATGRGKVIFEYAGNSPAAQDYQALIDRICL